jgi:hypothetical protein
MPVTNLHMNPIASRITVGVVIIETPNFQWHEVNLKTAIRDALIEALPQGTGVGEVSVEISGNCLRLREA